MKPIFYTGALHISASRIRAPRYWEVNFGPSGWAFGMSTLGMVYSDMEDIYVRTFGEDGYQ